MKPIWGLILIINTTEREHLSFNALLMAEETLLQELEVNSAFYPLTNMDYKLIETATNIFNKEMIAWEEKNKGILDSLDSIMNK